MRPSDVLKETIGRQKQHQQRQEQNMSCRAASVYRFLCFFLSLHLSLSLIFLLLLLLCLLCPPSAFWSSSSFSLPPFCISLHVVAAVAAAFAAAAIFACRVGPTPGSCRTLSRPTNSAAFAAPAFTTQIPSRWITAAAAAGHSAAAAAAAGTEGFAAAVASLAKRQLLPAPTET